jgi:hypothetical protein
MALKLLVNLIVCAGLLCVLGWGNQGSAAERVTLALSGEDCHGSLQAMTHALKQMEGVVNVQAGVVPDHLLIDQDTGRRTGEELASLVNALVVRPGCRAAVMQSCITAPGRSLAHAAAEREHERP